MEGRIRRSGKVRITYKDTLTSKPRFYISKSRTRKMTQVRVGEFPQLPIGGEAPSVAVDMAVSSQETHREPS